MTPTQILQSLPESLEWMVMFRLAAMRSFASDDRIREMYFLAPAVDLASSSHVVLTSLGRFLAPIDGARLGLVQGDRVVSVSSSGPSLFDRYHDRIASLPADDSDCIGFGSRPPLPPVLLHLKMEDGSGRAQALFQREPSQAHYELLKAIGVEYEGGRAGELGFVARFRNRLPTHIEAGALGGFLRTHHCNEFFLRHGEIDEELRGGLVKAARDRIAAGRRRALAACAVLARRASVAQLPMRCTPPPPDPPFPYGDLVPLGFLLLALNQGQPQHSSDRDRLREKLLASRNGDLWAFHTGRLVTSTDSALVLLGLEDAGAVAALERFSDGYGAYYPQLWSSAPESGKMVSAPSNRHWRQPDFATTCLIRMLRANVGQVTITPIALIEQWLDSRAGLYFANPYLVDWTVAKAIQSDGPPEMKSRLAREILSGRNQDGSFGRFDQALSTSCAILALEALGYRGRAVLLAQLRLLDWMGANGTWPESTPFYSTFIVPRPPGDSLPPQHLEVNGEVHELSLYRDEHKIIVTALAALALSADGSAEAEDSEIYGEAHPRYRCADHADYVQQVALPPYAVGVHAV